MKFYILLFFALLSLNSVTGFAGLSWKEERGLLEKNLSFQEHKSQILQESQGSWCSSEKASLLMDFVFLRKPKVCVEIGVFAGATILPIASTLKHIKKGKIFAVDAWDNVEAVKYWKIEDEHKKWWSSIDMKEVFSSFLEMKKKRQLDPYVRVVAKTSAKAATVLPPIDFIHIDGNPSKEGFLQDLLLYLPKVKIGGYVFFSNLLVSEGVSLPKVEALFLLPSFFLSYELVEEIEQGNACLLKKIHD